MYKPLFRQPLRLICCSSLLLGACQADIPGPTNQAGQSGPLRQSATPQASNTPALLNTLTSSSPTPTASPVPMPTPQPSAVTNGSANGASPQLPAEQLSPVASVRQPVVEIPMQSLRVPRGFDYAMLRQLALQVQVLNPNGGAYARVPVSIFADAEHSRLLAVGITDQQGEFQTALQLPLTQDQLNIQVSALGIDNARSVKIQGQTLRLNFGPTP